MQHPSSMPPPTDSQCAFRCFRCRVRACCRGAPSGELDVMALHCKAVNVIMPEFHPMPHLCWRAHVGLPCNSEDDGLRWRRLVKLLQPAKGESRTEKKGEKGKDSSGSSSDMPDLSPLITSTPRNFGDSLQEKQREAKRCLQ